MKGNCSAVRNMSKTILLICFMFALHACGSSEIKLVKQGQLKIDPSVTFGDAIDNYPYFDSTKWESFKDNKNRKIVQVTGKVKKENLNEVSEEERVQNVEVLIQCLIHLDGESFEVSYVGAKGETVDCGTVEAQGDFSWVQQIYGDNKPLINTSSAMCKFACNHQKDMFTAAAAKGDMNAVNEFLASGMYIDAKDRNGQTALMHASSHNKMDVAKALFEKGADVNARDKDGWTALMCAANYGRVAVVKELLSMGADVNIKSNGGGTALGCTRDMEVRSLLEESNGK